MNTENSFNGRYVCGKGCADKLRLIEKSFAMLRPNGELPFIQMVWNPEKDTFKEGFIWGNGFWMQNSYGFVLGAAPLLDEKWRKTLQNSLDLFWDRMGDGKRIGTDSGVPDPDQTCLNFAAPDGSLGDCVLDKGIVYRQGDGPFEKYDWFFEATACGILLECELLLFERDIEKMRKYIPLMVRSMEHIESRRAENGLYLSGASSNLLAPSFGSVPDENGDPDRSYLTGLAVTTLAAEERFAEVAALAGERELEKLCLDRARKTREALPLLLTGEGYFLKSMDKDGTPHGLYGAEKHGYLEGSANVDAVAHRAVGREVRESIMDKLDSVPGIRTAGVLCCNYPALDDAAFHVLLPEESRDDYLHRGGNWVDGGCWATVEGRNIIACLENGRAETAFTAAGEYMKWALDYRQDAPLSQWGVNSSNMWQQENEDHSVIGRPVSVMIDNFAPVTCLLRGLFSPRAYADRLELMLNLPRDISVYRQKDPLFFGGARLFLRGRTGAETPVAYLDGVHAFTADGEGHISVPAELLTPGDHDLFITSDGKGFAPPEAGFAPEEGADLGLLPPELELIAQKARETGNSLMLELVSAAAKRRELPFTQENFRPMTRDKKQAIIQLCDETAKNAAKALLCQDGDGLTFWGGGDII